MENTHSVEFCTGSKPDGNVKYILLSAVVFAGSPAFNYCQHYLWCFNFFSKLSGRNFQTVHIIGMQMLSAAVQQFSLRISSIVKSSASIRSYMTTSKLITKKSILVWLLSQEGHGSERVQVP